MSAPKHPVLHTDHMEWLDVQTAQRRADAGILTQASGLFFKRQLEYQFSEVLKADIPAPNAFRFFPISTEVGEGHKEYTQKMMQPVGEAIIVSNYADDLPRVNVAMREITYPIKMIGDSYGYSVDDIAHAQVAGLSLDPTLAMAAREAIERKHNKLCWWGDPETGIPGLLNHAYIPRFIFANALAAGATPADVVDEVNAFINSVNSLTKTTANVDTLLLPPDEYAWIMSTPRSTTSDTTIGQYLIMNNPFLQRIEQAWELAPELNGGKRLAVAYRANSQNVKYVAPVDFRALPVERRNLEFVINCIGKSGGFYTPRPLQMVIGELKAA